MSQTSWKSGKSIYNLVVQDGVEYAVLQGKSVADRDFIFMVKSDPKSGSRFFVQATTRAKSWELPDLADAAAAKDTRTMRDRILAMYNHYAPAKAGNVDTLLAKYGGNGEQLLQDLVLKYGSEPAPPPPSGNISNYLGDQSGMNDSSSTSAPPSVNNFGTPTANNFAAPSTNAFFAETSAAPTRSYRDRVIAIYMKYKPNKVSTADTALEQYKGQEEALIRVLVEKFGPEPEPDAPQPVATTAATAADTKPTEAKPQADSQPSSPDNQSMASAPPAAVAAVAEASRAPAANSGNSGTRSYRDRVYALYEKYKPSKLHTVDKALESYAGQEELLIQTLVEKMGPEPVPESPPPTATTPPVAAASEPTQKTEADPSQPAATSEPKQVTAAEATPQSSASPARNVEPQGASSVMPSEAPGVAPTQSTFDFGSTSSNGHATDHSMKGSGGSAAGSPSQNKGGSGIVTSASQPQEQLLVNFIQDRDERLKAAQSRTEQYSALLDDLRKQNALLTNQIAQVKAQAEMELQGMRSHTAKIQEETNFLKQSWELEREKLKAQADVAHIVAEKTVQGEKVQFEEDRATFQQERAQLQTNIAKLEAELHIREQKASALLEMLDTKDSHLRHLAEELAELKLKARPIPNKHIETQTDSSLSALDGSKSGSPGPTRQSTMEQVEAQVLAIANSLTLPSPSATSATGNGHADASGLSIDDDTLFEQYDSLIAAEKLRRDELSDLRSRAREYEKEISRLRKAVAARGAGEATQLQNSNAPATPAQKDCEECQKRNKVIQVLRVKSKQLESKVNDLELTLLAQPTTTAIPAGADSAAERHKLEATLASLQQELNQHKSQSRSQKKEIADLRGLLAIHMSHPSGGLRAALGDRRSPPNGVGGSATSTSNKSPSPSASRRANAVKTAFR